MPKTWTLTINNSPLTLTLAPPNQRGYCFRCRLEKPIQVISEHPRWIGSIPTFEARKFCSICSRLNLYELENGDYQMENKKAILSELRNYLKY